MTGQIVDPRQRAEERANMVVALEEAGLFALATTHLGLATEEALAWPKAGDRVNALFGLANRLEGAGVNRPVERLLLLILDEGSSAWQQRVSRQWVVETALAVGSREAAERAWSDAAEQRRSYERTRFLAPFLAERGESEEARQVVEEGLAAFRESWQKGEGGLFDPLWGLNYLSGVFLQIGEPDLARALFPERLEVAEQTDDWEEAFWGWLLVARHAQEVGETALARELVEKSRRLARKSIRFRWWSPRGDSYWWNNLVEEHDLTREERAEANSALARTYTVLGMWEEARAAASLVDYGWLRGDPMERLGVALAHDGQEAAALEIATALESSGMGRWEAAKVVDAVVQLRLEAGQPEEAWEAWANHQEHARHVPAYRFLEYWRSEGDLEALLDYTNRQIHVGPAAAGAWQAALAIEDRGATADDLPALTDLVAKVLATESQEPTGDIYKTNPLIDIARILHALGQHGEAVVAMEAAEELVLQWEPTCEIWWYATSPEGHSARSCPRRSWWQEEMTAEQHKTLIRPYVARGWAEIGEFDRALAVVEGMVPMAEEGEAPEFGPFPRLDALRWIGVAMLEQGVSPSNLESLVDSVRPGDLVPAP
ncbi:hypothetical protein IIA16_01155 [bacterium]|nr:hypothetical protein [bacterium]